MKRTCSKKSDSVASRRQELNLRAVKKVNPWPSEDRDETYLQQQKRSCGTTEFGEVMPAKWFSSECTNFSKNIASWVI